MKRTKVARRVLGRWPDGTLVSFFVAHQPVAKGSMSAFVPLKWARAAVAAGKSPRAVVTDQKGSDLIAYENAVRAEATVKLDGRALPCAREQPFSVTLGLVLPRLKGDLDTRTGRLRPGARATPWVEQDVDKLARATLDALTGTAWDNDSRVVRLLAEKQYPRLGDKVGVWINIAVRPSTVIDLVKNGENP